VILESMQYGGERHAATDRACWSSSAWKAGYRRLNEPLSDLLRTPTRTSRKGCKVHRFHRICCFLIMRFDKISLTALSTNAVEIGSPSCRRRPHQRATVCMKIFDQIGNLPSGGDCAAHVADVNGVKPVHQFRQAAEAGA
jgi:hypothetical protein